MKNENILISNPRNFKGTAAIHLLGLSFKYAVSTQCVVCHLPIRLPRPEFRPRCPWSTPSGWLRLLGWACLSGSPFLFINQRAFTYTQQEPPFSDCVSVSWGSASTLQWPKNESSES